MIDRPTRRYAKRRWLTSVTAVAVIGFSSWLSADETNRVTSGLLALYHFEAGEGNLVRDRSGVRTALDLKIVKPSAVKWGKGSLSVRSSTNIISSGPSTKIIEAIKRSGSLTVEAWIRPQNVTQDGPARIVSISKDTSARNFTLGQDATAFDMRLRTKSTSSNGIPSTATGRNLVKTRLSHIVSTLDAAGNVRIYLDGKQVASKKLVGGLSAWDANYRLVLANEITGDRPWIGDLHLVAVYSRALTHREVQQNSRAGIQARMSPRIAERMQAEFFETSVARVLARNCLDCHDAASRKGDLNLSQKSAAFAGGESGKVVVPGKPGDSLLWQLIEKGDMPAEGAPLTSDEKKTIRKWIEQGAVWSGDVIDPAIFTHQDKTEGIWLQRLTYSEYIETVRHTLGVEISQEAAEILPHELRADGFSNTAYNLNVDLKHVEAYSKLAAIVVGRMDVLKFASRFSKSRSLSTDSTMRDFVGAMGKWILRGPLDDRQITNYSGIATTVASVGGNYEQAVELIIEAMIQSPRFVYRMESQKGDGSLWPADGYEIASRISYIVWGGPPDRELMKLAEAGELQDRDRVKSQVERMLGDPRAIEHSRRFITDWLHLDRLRNLRPNRDKFPKWNPALAEDMRDETLLFFEDVCWKQQRPLSDLMNAQVSFLTPRLARHYDIMAENERQSRYDLTKVAARGGLLTQASVLTIGGDDASMVTRGLFVLHDLLRGTVKDPPPGLDVTPVPPKPGMSHRSIAESRIGNMSCGGCHIKFEPLAFGLEKYDGLGAYHEIDEHRNSLREDGNILFPGDAKPMPYSTTAELMDLLAASDRVRLTITWKITQFCLGRPLGSRDASTVRRIHERGWSKGGKYSDLITAVVTSDLVMMTRTEAAK